MKKTRASWENIADILGRETVKDTDLAARLECTPEFVARVRHDLGMPADEVPQVVRKEVTPPLTDQERYDKLSVPVEGGHRKWTGRFHRHTGTPLFNRNLTVYAAAFRLHHGMKPVGNVLVECDYPRCVEATCLSDRLMREQRRADEAALR